MYFKNFLWQIYNFHYKNFYEKKDIGVIIRFCDKEYSKEENIFLYQRLISILLEAKDIKIDSKIIENTVKALVSKIFKTSA